MKKSEAKEVYKLFKQLTRAEIMARHGHSAGLEFGDYYTIKLEKLDEMRRLLYGTDDLIKLGTKWSLLEKEKPEKRERKKLKGKKKKKRSLL